MKGKFFWILLTLLMVIASHIGYILYAPVFEMDARMQRQHQMITGDGPAIWSAQTGSSFLVGADPYILIAACQFNLTQGDVEMQFSLPDSYWSVSAYTKSGSSFYSVNDRQANTNDVKLVIRSLDQVEEATAETVSNDSGMLVVKSPVASGMIVIRTRIDELITKNRLVKHLAKSKCYTGRQ